jgi:hypothetical protein
MRGHSLAVIDIGGCRLGKLGKRANRYESGGLVEDSRDRENAEEPIGNKGRIAFAESAARDRA